MDNLKESIIRHFTPGERVLIAMSGGVDSSTVAWAAKEVGCIVHGVTLWLYGDGTQFKDAEKVAAHLGIDWHLADYREYFNEDVISPYINTYKKGETPNPCCICNRVGKTKYLFDEMNKCGMEKIATGHYASLGDYKGRKVIQKAFCDMKDQSYYLSLMNPFHIQYMLFPLSGVDSKENLRQFAAQAGLCVAPKKDSYEACFLQGDDYRDFIFSKIGTGVPGDFTLHGKRVAGHKGTFNYTIGQRRGLDVSHTEPLYVRNINTSTGEIELAEKEYVFKRGVRLRDCIFDESESVIFRGAARLRHKMQDAKCYVEFHYGNKAVILFDDEQFAPAPGQVTAIYDGDRLIGGGIVESSF